MMALLGKAWNLKGRSPKVRTMVLCLLDMSHLKIMKELRMHILGLNSCYCQFLVRLRICMT